jgi:integrase
VLTGFGRFCQERGIGPGAVDEAALEAYRAWLSDRTYDLKVGTTINSVRRAWNTGARAVEGWPGRVLVAPPDPRVRALPLSALPASYGADLGAYLGGLSDPDPLAPPDPLDPRAGRPRSPVTVAERRRFLLRAASIVVEQGTPIERIDGLAALVTAPAMRTILLELHRRGGGAWTGQAVTMAMMLAHVARHHLRLPEAELGPLLELKRLVKEERKPGLSARNRGRLLPFDDPRLRRDLFRLPEELFAAADRLAAEGCPVRAAEAHERGLALGLLLLLPMRRRNLAALDAERHLRRDGRGHIVALRIPGAEVKNGIELDAAIPQALARRIDRHLRLHRPVLQRGEASAWLFPGQGGRHRSDARLSVMLTRAVRDALGVPFNLHLVRHLAATMLYDADPNNGPVVQRLLGHTQLKTTERVYGVLRTRGAQARWANQVDQARDAHRRAEARAVAGAGRGGRR